MRTSILIVGGGRVGRHVARDLDSSWYGITIVERKSQKCETLKSHEGSTVIEGDGTDRSTL